MRKFLLKICLAVMLVESLFICPVPAYADKYKEGKGDAAAYTDLAVSATTMALSMLKTKSGEIITKWIAGQVLQALKTALSAIFGGDVSWFAVFFSWNPGETLTALGRAAVNKWMRDATEITAYFTGAEGHVLVLQKRIPLLRFWIALMWPHMNLRHCLLMKRIIKVWIMLKLLMLAN